MFFVKIEIKLKFCVEIKYYNINLVDWNIKKFKKKEINKIIFKEKMKILS